MIYPEPLPSDQGLPLAGGWVRFERVRLWSRDAAPQIVAARSLPSDVLDRLTQSRAPIAGISHSQPRLMGVLNLTPDSFSDGGQLVKPAALRARLTAMAEADLIDAGAESTRPGAEFVPPKVELERLAPIWDAVPPGLLSIDTRKAPVAQAALAQGVAMINDVSGGTFDPDLIQAVARSEAALCLMHGPFDPSTMQDAPNYMNVVLDVFDFLSERLAEARAAGIPDHRLMIDPGIGFGKTTAHNLALIHALPLFHALGVPVLLGVSRKRLIGELGHAPQPLQRLPGTLALTLHAVAQGVQWHRVHDVAEIAQGLALWKAARGMEDE